jgi:valyl-tRNA synthetase
MANDEAAKEETRRVMGWVIDQCLILLHPIMPFITEELWGALGERAKMVVHADWPTYTAAELVDIAADREMNWVISLIEGIRSARSQMRGSCGSAHSDDRDRVWTAAGQAAWARNEAMILKTRPCCRFDPCGCLPQGVDHRGGSGRYLWPATRRYYRH